LPAVAESAVIGVPDAVLLKPAKLTTEEWKEMRRHPDIGYDMIRSIEFLSILFAITVAAGFGSAVSVSASGVVASAGGFGGAHGVSGNATVATASGYGNAFAEYAFEAESTGRAQSRRSPG
jgi:hypothetical protein